MHAEFDAAGRIILTPELPVEQWALRRWAGDLAQSEGNDVYRAEKLICNHQDLKETQRESY